MGLPKDIIGIVRNMKWKLKKKRLNKNYHDLYRTWENYEKEIGLLYAKNLIYVINFRHILRPGHYRKHIVCFLTDKQTKYEVPKNY